MMTKIVIFDVCDTLYDVNTTFSFLDHYFAKDKKYKIFRKISKLFLIKVTNYLFDKVFGKDLIKILGTSFLKNKKFDEIIKFNKFFVNNVLSKLTKKKIVKKLNYYKKNGYHIVFMSGSYDFIINEVANYFDVTDFYSSKLKIINKKYTGRYQNDILMSKYNLFKKNFKNLEELIVISNNFSDLRLMNLADQAYAVCNKKSDLKFWNNYNNIICIEDFK